MLTHRLQDSITDLGSVGSLLLPAYHMATVSWLSMAATLSNIRSGIRSN